MTEAEEVPRRGIRERSERFTAGELDAEKLGDSPDQCIQATMRYTQSSCE